MISLPEANTAWFDVDDTLVKWDPSPSEKEKLGIHIECPGSFILIDDELVPSPPWIELLVPHRAHIEQLKKHAMRGHQVIVWSAGGAGWAKAVVLALGLEKYVTLTIGKPTWVFDDLQPNEFIPQPRWMKDE